MSWPLFIIIIYNGIFVAYFIFFAVELWEILKYATHYFCRTQFMRNIMQICFMQFFIPYFTPLGVEF